MYFITAFSVPEPKLICKPPPTSSLGVAFGLSRKATATLHPATGSSEVGFSHPETKSKSVISSGIGERGEWSPSDYLPLLPQ